MSSLIELLENRQLFVATATGLPDASFASGGVATVSFRSDVANDSAAPVAVLTDTGGRSYVVAQTKASAQVRRVDSFGVVDTTYANARGLIGLPLDSTKQPAVDAVSAALDAADRLLVLAGNKLFRFTVSGKIDRTFGTNGVVDLSGLFSGTKDIAVDSGNRIYVVGSAKYGTDANGAALYRMRVTRLRSVGAVDKSFASSGLYTAAIPTAMNGDEYADGSSIGSLIRIAANQTVTAVAAAQYQLTDTSIQFLSRVATGVQSVHFDSTGQPDQTYGAAKTGLAEVYDRGDDVNYVSVHPAGIRSDGTVVYARSFASADADPPIGGTTDYQINATGTTGTLFRLNPNDSLVSLDGAAQFVTPNDGSGGDFVVDQVNDSLYHRKSDGTLDTTFTGRGTTTPIGLVTDAALPGDGTLITLNTASKALALNVGRIFTSSKPVANLASKPLMAPGPLIFNVVYKSAAGFATHGTLNGSEIQVNTGSGSGIHPTVLQTTTLPGNVLNVRYKLTDTDGSFTFADDGKYPVELVAGKVTDSAGNVAAAQELGSVVVAI